jgi:hypothetical protein
LASRRHPGENPSASLALAQRLAQRGDVLAILRSTRGTIGAKDVAQRGSVAAQGGCQLLEVGNVTRRRIVRVRGLSVLPTQACARTAIKAKYAHSFMRISTPHAGF